MKYSHKQHGLSLIELMIAMVVSLVLVAGVGTVYMSSKRNYHARDQFSLMDETARVALNALTKHLEHAGYATPTKLPLGDYMYPLGGTTPPKAPCNSSDKGVHPSLNLTTFAARATQDSYKPDGVTTTGDAVSVRFLGDSTLFTDCANGELPEDCRVGKAPSMEAALIYNTFFVNESTGYPTLMCSGSRNNDAAPIANGVENIQFLYGVDTNADGNVDQYLNATGVSAAAAWLQVVSIKVGILVRSLEQVLPTAEAKSYDVLDTTLSRNDRFQRSVYTAVIHLRNVVEG
ncbi:MAG: PilW family protein [Candidatus Thiothrix sulfatifontis]|nr:MAG: PilW family protein [Candidatus Thiothrix sulfatifontis]